MATTQSARNDDWIKTQTQYWDSWFQHQKGFMDQMKASSPLQGQWSEFFSEWQKLACGSAQPGANAYSQMFSQAGAGFIQMMEQFYQSAGASKQPEDAVMDWMSSMQKFFEGLLHSNTAPADATAQYKSFMETMTHAAPAWWSAAFKAPAPGSDHPHHSTAFLFDPFGFYASIPGVGYSREKQEHINLLYRLWVGYEAKMRQYNTEMTKVGLQALRQFQDYLQNPPEGQAPLQSLKDVYVKWVDVAEEVYARYALSEEYTSLYGDVVNALMAYKKQLHVLTDDMVEQFNLPTRQELDSLHQRAQQLKRENAQMKKDIEALKEALQPKKAAAGTKAAKTKKGSKK